MMAFLIFFFAGVAVLVLGLRRIYYGKEPKGP